MSVRVDDTLLTSKTNTSFSRLMPEDIVACDLDGRSSEEGKPSKEVAFHAAIYRLRPEAGAVVPRPCTL